MMDLRTRIEASLEFMNDGGPIGDRVDFVNLREVLEGSREALLKLDAAETREKGLRRKLEIVEEYATSRLCSDHQGKWSRDRCVMCELERAESRLDTIARLAAAYLAHSDNGLYRDGAGLRPGASPQAEDLRAALGAVVERREPERSRCPATMPLYCEWGQGTTRCLLERGHDGDCQWPRV